MGALLWFHYPIFAIGLRREETSDCPVIVVVFSIVALDADFAVPVPVPASMADVLVTVGDLTKLTFDSFQQLLNQIIVHVC